MISRKLSYELFVLGCQFSAAKFLAWARVMAVDEVGCRHSFLSFHLQFEQLKRGSAATSDKKVATFDRDFTAF